MTSPPREVEVCCPNCALQYVDWYRPSLNLDLDDFDESYIDTATSAVCPNCQHKVYFEHLTVRDGVFYTNEGGESDAAAPERSGT
jgi:hypothetical protein